MLIFISLFLTLCLLSIALLAVIARQRRHRLQITVGSAEASVDKSGATFRAHLRSKRAEHEAVDERALLGYAPAACETLVRFAPPTCVPAPSCVRRPETIWMMRSIW